MHFTIIEKVADIQKFDSVDALKEKIKDNVKKATEILLEPR